VSDDSTIVVELSPWIVRQFADSRLADRLTSRTQTAHQFLRRFFLPNIDTVVHEDRDALLIDVLLRADPRLDDIVREFYCIPTSPVGVRLRQPDQLVDPRSPIAGLYQSNDSVFPHGDSRYSTGPVLDALLRLGMMSSAHDLPWSELIDRAHVVGASTSRQVAVQQSTVFLRVLADKLSQNSTFVGLRQIQQQLTDIPFLPAMPRPMHFPLEWKASSEIVHKPSEMFPAECRDLVGCIQLIVDSSVFPSDSCNELMAFLRIGMDWREPSISQVVDQLDILTKTDTENYLNNDHVIDTIQTMLYSICTFLQSKLTTGGETRAISSSLSQRYFVLGHGRFLSPKQIAFDFPHRDCAPYLYAVPESYKRHFSDLLRAAGVRERFQIKDYIYALASMHDIYADEPLGADECRLALQLASLLHDELSNCDSAVDVVGKYGPIYVPDSRNRLQSTSELCYNEPGMTSPSDTTSTATTTTTGQRVVLSHPMIPYGMSQQLGVNTKRRDVLKKHSRGIPFGQHEPLTNRIKRILSSYPCDKEILKELLQNADDAGATEIHFVNDRRQHGTERVFDDSYQSLQGPALCVFNNRPFSESDLIGIQQLGQGNKSCDPNIRDNMASDSIASII
jgi:sacsin